jgi:DNA-binding LacI/PurR family transcriptional regulator
MKKRVTIKDIAKKAGVNHSTVSRVINENPAISEKTKKKILKIMADLNYRPNLIARGLVKSKTNAFALITPDINPHVTPIVRGVTDTCRRLNYGLMLFSTDYWLEETRSYLEVVRNWLVDGVLIYNVIYHKDIPQNIKELQKEEIPFVFLNKFIGSGMVNAVGINNYSAVELAIEHLVDIGRKRIAVINGGMMSVDGVERFEAFKKVLEKFDIEFDKRLIGEGNFFYDEAYEETKRLLTLNMEKPDAIFCANDLMAIAAINAARDRGLKVPEDIAVVGFDDLEAGRYFSPALTTIRPPHQDLGGKAIDLLLKIIENPKRQVEEISLDSKLIVRESTVK